MAPVRIGSVRANEYHMRPTSILSSHRFAFCGLYCNAKHFCSFNISRRVRNNTHFRGASCPFFLFDVASRPDCTSTKRTRSRRRDAFKQMIKTASRRHAGKDRCRQTILTRPLIYLFKRLLSSKTEGTLLDHHLDRYCETNTHSVYIHRNSIDERRFSAATASCEKIVKSPFDAVNDAVHATAFILMHMLF